MRIFSALFILFFLIPGQGTSHFSWLSSMPPDFYAPPPGPMMLFDQFPPLLVFQIIHTVIVISLIAMLAGYRTRWSSVIAGVSILLLQGFIFSVGKINHEILVAVVPILMAFSNWGERFSIDSFRKKNRDIITESWPLPLLAVIIGFMMFTAGFPKILGGWLDPSTQATYGHLLNQFFVKERQDLLSGFFVHLDSPIFWEFLDWATILFEVGFLISVYKIRWFRFFLGGAVLFHFSTMLTLNIAFLPNFLAYALFLNWDSLYQSIHQKYKRVAGKLGERSEYRSVLSWSLILLVFFATVKWLNEMDLILPQSDLVLSELLFLSMALAIVIVFAVLLMNEKLRNEDRERQKR